MNKGCKMKLKMFLILALLAITFMSACSSNEQQELGDESNTEPINQAETSPAQQKECPAECDDDNVCTTDTCSAETNYECVFTYKDNCCGNERCEQGESHRNCLADCAKPELPKDLSELIETATTKVTKPNFRYTFKGAKGQDVYTYHVYGDKVRIDLPMYSTYKGFQFTRVYLDLTEKTAEGYCHTQTWCDVPGTQFDFDYEDYLGWVPTTPLDKLHEIDNGEVVETVNVDRKESKGVRYINSKGIEEKIWIWTYYGMPIKYSYDNEKGEKITFEFRDLVVNSLSKADVELPE